MKSCDARAAFSHALLSSESPRKRTSSRAVAFDASSASSVAGSFFVASCRRNASPAADTSVGFFGLDPDRRSFRLEASVGAGCTSVCCLARGVSSLSLAVLMSIDYERRRVSKYFIVALDLLAV